MTIPSTITGKVSYLGDGTTKTFPVPFIYFADTNGNVYLSVVKSDTAGLVETTLTQGTDFTITDAGQPSGTLTLANPITAEEKLTITYDVPYSQLTDYEEFGRLPSESIEKALDLLTMLCIQLRENISRCVKVGVASTTDPNEVTAQVARIHDSIDNVDAVAGNAANINAVNANKTNINAVAGNAANINNVAGNKANIDNVAGNKANINTVVANLADIQATVANLAAILDAPEQAADAADSAQQSKVWAEGTDTQVQALGGVHSAKVWLGIILQAASAATFGIKVQTIAVSNWVYDSALGLYKIVYNDGCVVLGAYKDGQLVNINIGYSASGATLYSDEPFAGTVMKADGTELSIHDLVSQAQTYATNATNAASAAATSESNALSYKNSAATSASTANTQAGIATDKATAAGNSASAASASATNAATSANQAANSATNAANSATGAASSASSALSYKNAAATSETNALSYKNAASTSAGLAAESATAAAGSATAANECAESAAGSSGSAATSEANALSYKNAAEQSAENAADSATASASSATAAAGSATSAAQSAADAAESAQQAAAGQIQADWNQTSASEKDFIKNKPTDLSAFTNNAGYAKTADVNAAMANKADKSDTYTKSEMDTALAAKAPLNSPTFTGTPTMPTAATTTSNTQAANTAFVHNVAAAHKAVFKNAALTPANGVVSWAVSNSLGTADIIGRVSDSSGNQIVANITASASTVTVVIPATGTVAANTYTLTIYG